MVGTPRLVIAIKGVCGLEKKMREQK